MYRNPSALASALFLLAAGIEAHAACTAANPAAYVTETTPTSAFTDNGDGTVTHSLTGLMWQQSVQGPMTWRAALAAAVADTSAGYTDWRLPNKKELESIVESCGYSPAINQTVFPATLPMSFWSGSTYAVGADVAWSVNFYNGTSTLSGKAGASSMNYVRLVRGGQTGGYDAQPDTMPNTFGFTAQTGVAPSTVVASDSITVSGIDSAATITVSGGSYAINGGAYVTADGTVNNGDTVTVRQTSSASAATTTTTTLTIGGVTGVFDVTTAGADTTPDAFSLTAQTGVAPGAVATSNTITVSGIDSTTAISISGGSFSIDGGPYSAVTTKVGNGQTVSVRLTASASYATTTSATLTIGGVSATFDVTTQAAPGDTTPNAFGFTAQTGVTPGAAATSNIITVSGIDSPAPIDIVGGTYSINGGAFVSAHGTVTAGQTVAVRLTASASYATMTSATLTIGGVSGVFDVTTASAPAVPTLSEWALLLLAGLLGAVGLRGGVGAARGRARLG